MNAEERNKRPLDETQPLIINQDGNTINTSVNQNTSDDQNRQVFVTQYDNQSQFPQRPYSQFTPENPTSLQKSLQETVPNSADMTAVMYLCVLCGRSFINNDALLHHTKTHLNSTLPHAHIDGFACYVCLAILPTKDALLAHLTAKQCTPVSTMENDPDEQKTTATNYSTPSKYVKSSDEGRPYACPVCSAKFHTPDRVKRHQIVHETEKNYKCAICPAAFKRKDKLQRHMLVHDPTRPLTCPFVDTGCTKAFNRKDKFKAHMLRHVKKNPTLDSTIIIKYMNALKPKTSKDDTSDIPEKKRKQKVYKPDSSVNNFGDEEPRIESVRYVNNIDTDYDNTQPENNDSMVSDSEERSFVVSIQ